MDITPLAVPAWWDPKARKAIFDHSTVVCGILVAGASSVTFASPDGVEFDLPLGGLRVTWSQWGMRIRLHASSTYLLYLLPPTEDSPRLSRNAVLAIAGHLTTASDLADLSDLVTDIGDLAGNVADVADILGNSVKAYSGVAALRQARRSHHALRQYFAPAV